mmetsp:Transcript_37864/g.100813  ORF Transcript_37864/g.100813 Transcript_37864/m.100813 type:complete len:95 (-) Transcript_37864:1175-1459(-)
MAPDIVLHALLSQTSLLRRLKHGYHLPTKGSKRKTQLTSDVSKFTVGKMKQTFRDLLRVTERRSPLASQRGLGEVRKPCACPSRYAGVPPSDNP